MGSSLERAAEAPANKHCNGALEVLDGELDDDAPADAFLRLARARRMRGAFTDARRVIGQGRRAHPRGVGLVEEAYRLAVAMRDWPAADAAVDYLLRHEPVRPEYYFDRGRVRGWLGDAEGAETAYIAGLELSHGSSLAEIIERVAEPLREIDPTIDSEYRPTLGRNNLGSIIHRGETHSFFTKISRWGSAGKREKQFFERELPRFPELAQVTPTYRGVLVEDGVSYLTLDLLPGEPAGRRDLQRVIELTETYTRLPYAQIRSLRHRRKNVTLTRAPISVISLFCEIHERDRNEQIPSLLRNVVASDPELESVASISAELERTILRDEVWGFVDPMRHYSVLHGEVAIANMMEDPRDRLRIFDWATFTVGPRFLDVARYVTSVFYTVDLINDGYLRLPDGSRRMEPVEEVLFWYAAVLLYVVSPSETIPHERRVREFIRPAMAELRAAHRRFRRDFLRHLSRKERLAWVIGRVIPNIKYSGTARYAPSYARNRAARKG